MPGALRILVADSSTFMRIMLAQVLKSLGVEVLGTARDSGEALDKTLELSPDILLLDLAIAEPGDFSIVRAIMEKNPRVTVFLMIPRGYADEAEAVVDGVRAGAKGYIRRPFSENKKPFGTQVKDVITLLKGGEKGSEKPPK